MGAGRPRSEGDLFSFGDKPIHRTVTRDQPRRLAGVDAEHDLSAAECLRLAERSFEVFHIVLREGFARTEPGFAAMKALWRLVFGERVLVLDGDENPAELVMSAIPVAEGADPEGVAAS